MADVKWSDFAQKVTPIIKTDFIVGLETAGDYNFRMTYQNFLTFLVDNDTLEYDAVADQIKVKAIDGGSFV